MIQPIRLEEVPYGSDASTATYECVDCGERIPMFLSSYLPPCPNFDGRHTRKAWRMAAQARETVTAAFGSVKGNVAIGRMTP